ncbi:histidine kinase [Actinomycetospora soli]|uniref:histidine kinase n=1 Tax=Actinomycetospora soli TaxID=2893887 RepID=UPI001E3D6DC2|nr:histidine kinase [Actinomycetospora soli]MCD2187872.1 histidine kinase [Actinomycetospora soli]
MVALSRGDDGAQVAAEPFLRGLRIAVCVIAGFVLIPSGLIRNADVYRPLGVQLAAWALLAAVVAVEAVLLVRHRSWGRARYPVLVLVLATSVAALLTIPPEQATSSANWIYGALGWTGLILLFDRPLPWIGGFLAVHGLSTALVVIGVDRAPADIGLNLLVASLGALGFPLATALATATVRRVAGQAAAASRAAQQVRTEEAVAVELHRARQDRFAGLHDSALPLLRGLADRTLDPADPDVQRACAIEAARMRRLFAETDETPDPLLHEVRHGVDFAERRGVIVEMQARGRWPAPPPAVRRALLEAPMAALATAATRARVTVLGADDVLSVSVVADGAVEPSSGADGVEVQTARDQDQMWVEARWTIQPTPASPSPSSTTTARSATGS